MSSLLAFIGLLAVALPLAVCTGVLGMVWEAWWLYPAWTWFIVPLGLPPITFWHFIALTFLLHVVMMNHEYRKDERSMDWPTFVGSSILAPMIAWAVLRWLQ